MRGEQAIFNLEIKKKSGLSINPDIHHSKVFSSGYFSLVLVLVLLYKYARLNVMKTKLIYSISTRLFIQIPWD